MRHYIIVSSTQLRWWSHSGHLSVPTGCLPLKYMYSMSESIVKSRACADRVMVVAVCLSVCPRCTGRSVQFYVTTEVRAESVCQLNTLILLKRLRS